MFQAVYVFEARSSENTVFVAVKIDLPGPEPEGDAAAPEWPEAPWWAHPVAPAQLSEMTAELQEADLIAAPELDSRVRQVSRAQSAPLTGRILTDDFAPVDVTPQRR